MSGFTNYLLILLLFTAELNFTQWNRIIQPASGEAASLEYIDNTFIAGIDSLLYLSYDGGETWTPTNPITNSFEIISAVTRFKGHLFAGTLLHGIYISPDTGQTWQQINNGLTGLGALSVSAFAVQGNRLIAGTEGAGTFILNDNMQSWSSFGSLPLNISGTVYSMTNHNDTLYAGAGVNGQYYRLLPDSTSWEEITFSNDIFTQAASFLWFNDHMFIGSNESIYRSTDGLKWEGFRSGIQQNGDEIFLFTVNNNLYAIQVKLFASFFYSSTDNGETWINNEQYDIAFTYAVKTYGNKIFVAREDGLLYRIIEPTSVDENNIPSSDFQLHQNYPNPFNPETVISYTIGKSQVSVVSKVKLIIYDILGREVELLVNEEQRPGIYNVPFDASTLSSGVYFYRLDAGNFSSIKKMIIIN